MLITNGGSSGWDEGLIALVDWVDAAWELNGGAVKLNLRAVGMEAPVGQGLTLGTGLWGGDSGETGENCDTSKTAKAMRRGKNLGDKNWSMSSSR